METKEKKIIEYDMYKFEVVHETEKPELPILEPLEPQPRFQPSKKVNKIVGVVTLVVAVVGIGVALYLSFR